jgi:uncharacterized membrane protein YedE/YeeE
MNIVAALITGLIFGIGLIVSGMVNPAKVQNFLDVFGQWDPSLAFVMGGAIAVTLPGYMLLKKMHKPLFSVSFHWPTRTDLDARLVIGAAIFGIGWGLGGLCPGPAMTVLSTGGLAIVTFVIAMLAGVIIARFLTR